MGIIDSLWVRLGFKIDAEKLKEFDKLAEKAKSTMLGLGAAVVGAATGVGLMVKHTAEKMSDVQDFAEQMGMASREVEALGKVARENDSSIEAMLGGIQTMVSMTGQAAAGIGRGAMMFKKWGLHAKNADGSTKDVNEVLGEVVDKIASLDRAKGIALGQRLGFDLATINLMAKGRANFEKLRAEALKSNPFAEEDYELADKTEKSFRKASSAVGLLNKRIAVALMPTVNRVLDQFIKWTKEKDNVARLTRTIEVVVSVLERVWNHLGKVLAVIGVAMVYKVGAWFGDWALKAAKAAKEMGNLQAAGSLLKNFLTGTLIAAIALIVEDLWTFYEGGESVTGLLLKKFPYAVEVAQGAIVALGATLAAVATGSGPLGLLVMGIGGLIIAANNLRENWEPVRQWWIETWDDMFNAVARVVNAIPKVIGRIGGFNGEVMSLDVLKRSENTRLKLAQFGGENYRPWSSSEEDQGPWWTKKGSNSLTTSTTTTINGGVSFNLPNATGGQQAAREAYRELTRLAQGGVGG